MQGLVIGAGRIASYTMRLAESGGGDGGVMAARGSATWDAEQADGAGRASRGGSSAAVRHSQRSEPEFGPECVAHGVLLGSMASFATAAAFTRKGSRLEA